ncbi:XRE family transcriptional regulator [Dysgonomonas capnocytophagoides]|uniref:XRE family transcriptional regulator n=1 Tax=Dysgonomonas capnocytophagoides TaxID=45254 RepID=A0A4Y8L1E8_9BACT|nr:helix-turn-helix transcriptional regulator [Dysgonomonas capnocytophagoides]TFD96403.1 XRE family transcriptional regulator [Dysgonomonas capnocytophagoides]
MNYRIKELCRERGITLSELADKIDMKSANLSVSLSDKGNPTITTLQKIATALNVPVSGLFDEVQPNDNVIRCPNCGTELELKQKK